MTIANLIGKIIILCLALGGAYTTVCIAPKEGIWAIIASGAITMFLFIAVVFINVDSEHDVGGY